jgi:hypothetical protein
MRVRSGTACAVAVLFLTSGIAGGADPGVAPQPATGPEIEYDSTLLRIDLQENGTADWTIEYRVTLDDENATDAFEALRDEIRANRSTVESQFADRMSRTARDAENATGREMEVRNVSVSTRTDAVAGVVAYRFRWTDFAVASGGDFRAGDAISGLVLDSGTTLSMTWPEEYDVAEITPDADERRSGVAIWNPPETFGAEEPRLVLERGGGGTDSVLLGVLAVVILALVAAGWRFRDRLRPPVSATASGGDGRDAAGSGATGGGTSGDDGGGSTGGGEDDPPAELLSNEERVLGLLEENGGRMKQQQVVQELGWTDAKTSQVVGTLREDGEIEVFRIGRENVLALPGETDV